MHYHFLSRYFALVSVPIVLLCGCASLTPVSTGEALVGRPASSVEAQFGKAPEQYVRADGGMRWLYPTRPLGPYTYAADFDKSGRLSSFRQILTAADFAGIRIDQSRQEDVLNTFGKPEYIAYFPSIDMTVWSYRFRYDGGWWSLMHLYFDRNSVIRRTQSTNDPMYLQDL